MPMPILTSNFSSSSCISLKRNSSCSSRCRALEQARTSFFGNDGRLELNPLQYKVGSGMKGGRGSVIVAVIKRRKEMPLDNVIQRQKKLKLVSKIRDILVKQPNRMMSLRELGKYRRDLGLTRKRRVIALLKKYPAVFEIVEEGVYSLYFRLTPSADKIYMEEVGIRQEMEERLVAKLRKIVMMSIDKRVSLEKISHLKQDLGLPDDFKTTTCTKYPQYFKVVTSPKGPALELSSWDPALAVSAAELAEADSREREIAERNLIVDRKPKFNRVLLPKGLNLKRGDRERLRAFKELPFFSPYADIKDLDPATMEAEKHACAVVHELLSLTIEKRTLVDHLTHFRDDYKFSQRIRAMLIRHPDMFYVSLKGTRDSVFLREAYRDSELIDKDPLVIARERLQALVSVGRFQKQQRTEGQFDEGGEKGNGEFSEEDEDEDWSDAEGDDIGGDDEWSDLENDEERKSTPFKRRSSPQDKAKVLLKAARRETYRRILLPVVKKELSTVTSDDKPRERW
ncbi:hypothetical protein SUGI_0632050 [Cryptomeria japonica]|nr:hypothetical protein SUGI_0632050 [Cryptomeria japonica]